MVFGWYLCEMARKLKNGAEISHVIQEFEKQMNCMEIILGPYSLKQMKKSGRISAAAAVMGELMGVRPIITLIDGKTKVESKVRGDDKVVPAMIELCKKRADGVENFDYMIGHTNIKQAEDLEKACRKAFGKAPLVVFELGGVVSANTGPDTVAPATPEGNISMPLHDAMAFFVAFRANLCYTPLCCAFLRSSFRAT